MSANAYQILFSIPQKSALRMGTEGGGVLRIEFSQESRAAIVAMLDRATARGGCVFAAAVVEVEAETKLTDIDDAPKEESKRSPATVDLRRAAKRRN